MTIIEQAPTWDMTVVFPSLSSSEYSLEFAAIQSLAAELTSLFDARGIIGGTTRAASDPATFDELLPLYFAGMERYYTLESYIYSFITTDANDTIAQQRLGEAEPLSASFRKLWTRLTTWIGERDGENLLASSKLAQEHEHYVRKAQIQAEKSMSPAEEDLAADLNLTGIGAWERLHGDITAQMQVQLGDGSSKGMPVVRNMAFDASREVRQDAYRSELAAWKTVETACASSMNAIKGSVNLLSTRRKWSSALDPALLDASMNQATLDAMLGAARAAFPEMRKYLRAKARLVSGNDRLSWYDLFAPLAGETKSWSFYEGADFVIKQFDSFSPRMGNFARRAVDERWIDALPRDGKRDGAFCMGLRRDESRLLQTWKPSFGAVSTLAHELGHGYHNLCLYGRTPFQKDTPMTLAETASIFCETVVSQAAMKEANEAERLVLLEGELQRMSQTIVDISSRFIFEQEVFDRRGKSLLSASEMCEIMLDAQEQTYGDGLTDERHPYMWAVKPHYYSGASYYNFPYMFGLLFSLGLYAKYLEDPEPFRTMYDEFLSSTGMASAHELAAKFGIDIQTAAFWDGSVSIAINNVREFESLTR